MVILYVYIYGISMTLFSSILFRNVLTFSKSFFFGVSTSPEFQWILFIEWTKSSLDSGIFLAIEQLRENQSSHFEWFSIEIIGRHLVHSILGFSNRIEIARNSNRFTINLIRMCFFPRTILTRIFHENVIDCINIKKKYISNEMPNTSSAETENHNNL